MEIRFGSIKLGNIIKHKRINLGVVLTTLGLLCFIILAFGDEDCDGCYSLGAMLAKLFVCGLVILLGSIFFTKRYLEMEELMFKVERQPILDTNEAVEGVPFAGDGIVESERVLFSPYTSTKCVYYHSIKEKYVKGRKSSYWTIVENNVEFLPFYIRDRRGTIKVDLRNMDDDFSNYKIRPTARHVPNPINSEIDCEVVLKRKKETVWKKLWGPLKTSTDYRKSEFVLKPDTKVFAYGLVGKDKAGDLFLHESMEHPLIVSRKGKYKYLEDFFKGGNLVYFCHFLAAFGFSIMVLALGNLLGMPFVFLTAPLLIGNGIITGSVVFSLYNRIIMLVHRAKNALSNIDIELKRRADLIPNLVRIVKKYSKYERELNKIIAEARASVMYLKEKPTIREKYEIPSLIAVIERYPKLKAAENFKALMRELIDTEERIAYSREFYNRTIMKYNIIIQEFPFLLISLPFRFKKMKYLAIARGRGVPKVKF